MSSVMANAGSNSSPRPEGNTHKLLFNKFWLELSFFKRERGSTVQPAPEDVVNGAMA
jgi:hypothetical protein